MIPFRHVIQAPRLALAAVSTMTAGRRRRGEAGQIIVIAALSMIAMIAFGALVLEGGNAYAQQRVVQNGADATANAGAVRLGQRLAGVVTTDANVRDGHVIRRRQRIASTRSRVGTRM